MLAIKDFDYGEQLGQYVAADTFTITAVKQIYQKAQEAGYGEDNIASVAKLFLDD